MTKRCKTSAKKAREDAAYDGIYAYTGLIWKCVCVCVCCLYAITCAAQLPHPPPPPPVFGIYKAVIIGRVGYRGGEGYILIFGAHINARHITHRPITPPIHETPDTRGTAKQNQTRYGLLGCFRFQRVELRQNAGTLVTGHLCKIQHCHEHCTRRTRLANRDTLDLCGCQRGVQDFAKRVLIEGLGTTR